MDDEQYHHELACKAWKLYYLTTEVQNRKQFYLPF